MEATDRDVSGVNLSSQKIGSEHLHTGQGYGLGCIPDTTVSHFLLQVLYSFLDLHVPLNQEQLLISLLGEAMGSYCH